MEEMAQTAAAGPVLESMQGSPLWQIIFIVMAGVFILTKCLSGWQSGGPRQLMGILGLVAAYGAALFLGPQLAGGLAPYILGPFILRALIAGLLLGLVVYGAVVVVGIYSFDRAREMEEGGVKRLYQITGALLGTIYGAALVLLVVVIINVFGTASQAMVEGQLAGKIREAEEMSARGELGPENAVTEIRSSQLAEWFARLKNSLLLGPGEVVVETADPLPERFYTMGDNAIRVMSDPVALRRFSEDPAVQEIMQDPKIMALAMDNELAHLLESGQYLAVIQHPKVAAAADDPQLRRKVTQQKVADAIEDALAGQREVVEQAEEAGRLRFESGR